MPPIVHDALRSPSQPLDDVTRVVMEQYFGHDFTGVRLHADVTAAESAKAVDALAYTVGNDVVFGAGQYAPGTTNGRQLVAHELTHVVQQAQAGRGMLDALSVAPPTGPLEREADVAAATCGAAAFASALSHAPIKVQRFPRPDDTVRQPPIDEFRRSEIPPLVHDALHSPGQTLDEKAGTLMKPRFGHDFSGVRVHADGRAADHDARLFPLGRAIALGHDGNRRDLTVGRPLIAQEAAHTQQIGQSPRIIQRKPGPKADAKLTRKRRIVAITAGLGAKAGQAILDDGELTSVALLQNTYPPGTFILNHKSNGKYTRAQPVLDRDGKNLLPGFTWENPPLRGSKERTYDWHDTVTITITATASQRINLLAPHIRQALTGGSGKEATEEELDEVADAGELLEAAGVKAEELASVEHQQWVRERTTGERGQEIGALQWAQAFVAERGSQKEQGEKGARDLISAAQLLAKEPLDLLGHGQLSLFVDRDDRKARLAMGLSYRRHKSIPLPSHMEPSQVEEWLVNLVLPFRAQLLQFEKLLLADLRFHAVQALDAAEASLLLCNKRYAGVWGDRTPAPDYFWRRLQSLNQSEAVISARDWRTEQRAKIDMESYLDRKSIESPYGLAPSVEDQLAFSDRESARDERREGVERTFGQEIREKTGLPLLPGKDARTLLDAANAEEAIGVLRSYVIDGSDKIRTARDKIQSDRVLYGAEVWIKEENDRLKAALGAGAGTNIAILVDRFARMRRSETSFWQDLLQIIEFIANFVPGPIGWGLRLGTAVVGAHEAVTEHNSQNAIYGVGGSHEKPSVAPVAVAGLNVVASAIPDFGAVGKQVAGGTGIGRAERAVANEADDAARLSTHGGTGEHLPRQRSDAKLPTPRQAPEVKPDPSAGIRPAADKPDVPALKPSPDGSPDAPVGKMAPEGKPDVPSDKMPADTPDWSMRIRGDDEVAVLEVSDLRKQATDLRRERAQLQAAHQTDAAEIEKYQRLVDARREEGVTKRLAAEDRIDDLRAKMRIRGSEIDRVDARLAGVEGDIRALDPPKPKPQVTTTTHVDDAPEPLGDFNIPDKPVTLSGRKMDSWRSDVFVGTQQSGYRERVESLLKDKPDSELRKVLFGERGGIKPYDRKMKDVDAFKMENWDIFVAGHLGSKKANEQDVIVLTSVRRNRQFQKELELQNTPGSRLGEFAYNIDGIAVEAGTAWDLVERGLPASLLTEDKKIWLVKR